MQYLIFVPAISRYPKSKQDFLSHLEAVFLIFLNLKNPKYRIAKTKTSQAQADNSYESFDREHEHVPPPMDFPKGISM